MVARIRSVKGLARLTGSKPSSRPARAKKVDLPMAEQIRLAGLPAGEPEHVFHPQRNWAFDLAWPGVKVALEREGATWTNGRHSRGQGYREDAIKYSEAAILGWLVIRTTADMERDGTALDLVQRALRSRGA